jgi:signal transduction histidine kinase
MQRARIVGLIVLAGLIFAEFASGSRSTLNVAAAVLAFVGVGCWGRWPMFSVGLVSCALLVSAGDGAASVSLVIAEVVTLALSAAVLSWRATAVAGSVVVAALSVTTALDDAVSAGEAAQPILVAAAVAIGVHAVRASVKRREDHARLQAELGLAQARADLARDVHDVTSHALMAVLTQLRVARRGVDIGDQEIAARGLDKAEGAAKNAIGDLRSLTLVIAGSGRQLSSCETLAEVFSQIREACSNFPTTTFRQEPTDGPIDPQIATTAIRVVQQCLANAAAHSPRSPAVISACVDRGLLRITASNAISADGDTGTQLGLTIMEHRVADVGGTIAAGPIDGEFVVCCELPLARVG